MGDWRGGCWVGRMGLWECAVGLEWGEIFVVRWWAKQIDWVWECDATFFWYGEGRDVDAALLSLISHCH